MKHWVSLGWDEFNQRLTITGRTSPTFDANHMNRTTKTIIERGANESRGSFALRVGEAAIQAAQGKSKDVN